MREETIGAITELISRIEPALGSEQVRSAVDEVLGKQPQALRLHALLEQDPHVLISGSSRIPPDLGRIITRLLSQGASVVQPPRCARCGQQRPLSGRDGADRICSRCGQRARKAPVVCAACARTMPRHAGVAGRDYCHRCWTHAQANTDERLRGFVHAHLPELSEAALDGAINTVKEGAGRERLLRLALECEAFGPCWLADSAPASRLFIGFYEALRQAGATLPPRSCGHCGEVTVLESRREGLTCCRSCYRAGQLALCNGCQKRSHLERRQPDGSRLCRSCTHKLEESWAPCTRCGKRRLIALRSPEGPLCLGCRDDLAVDTCRVCRQEASCRFAGSEKAICRRCQSTQRQDTCRVCARSRECRFAGTTKAICSSCSLRREPCTICDRVRILGRRGPDGEAICWGCVPRITEACSQCGRKARVSGRVEGDPYCQPCYRRHPASFRDCVRCGTHGRLHQWRFCDRCTAEDKVRTMIPDTLAQSDPRIAALRESCLASEPRRVLLAFRRKTTLAHLSALLINPGALTHEVLDEVGSESATRVIRSMLIEHELLPVRDEFLSRFEVWGRRAAENIPDASERRAFDLFVRWRHLRSLREQGTPMRVGQSVGRRQELAHVLSLLDWGRRRGHGLAALTQADVDAWLVEGPQARRQIAPFLDWAYLNRLCPRLMVPRSSSGGRSVTGTSEDERWGLLTDVLIAEDQDPRTRLAAALVLVYGIRVSRITHIRVDDIFAVGDDVFIRLGVEPLLLPENIAAIALQAQNRRDAARLLRDVEEHEWLFPGTVHGQPLSGDALTNRLNALGVMPRHARAGALASLAQQLPAPILARLTGLHVTSAVAWAEAVAASHAAYGALKLPELGR